MKQNSAEQPYEAYVRLREELDSIDFFIHQMKDLNIVESRLMIVFKKYLVGKVFRRINIPKSIIPEILKSAESKKKDIENELNNLVNGQ